MFDPPHPAAVFRAFTSLDEGVTAWIANHEQIGAKNPSYVEALNRGDTTAVAHALKQNGHYSADEGTYAKPVAAKKKELDGKLGITP